MFVKLQRVDLNGDRIGEIYLNDEHIVSFAPCELRSFVNPPIKGCLIVTVRNEELFVDTSADELMQRLDPPIFLTNQCTVSEERSDKDVQLTDFLATYFPWVSRPTLNRFKKTKKEFPI